MNLDHLNWPFFEDQHRALAHGLGVLAPSLLTGLSHNGLRDAVDADCKLLVQSLGREGWLRHAVPRAYGGASDALDSRSPDALDSRSLCQIGRAHV